MKRILILLAIFIACNQTSLTKRESDREHDGFVGPVKKVSVVWSPISGSNYAVGSRCRQLTAEYDESGRLMRHSVYPGDCGRDEIREVYSYSPDGSRSAKTKQIRAADSPPPPPPIVSPSSVHDDMDQARTEFKYDSLGRLTETTIVRPGGKPSYKTTYSYDEKGRLNEVSGHDADGQITVRRVYGFTGEDRVPSTFTYYDGAGKVYERTTYTDYEFNSTGDWVKRKQMTQERLNRVTVALMIREIDYYPIKK